MPSQSNLSHHSQFDYTPYIRYTPPRIPIRTPQVYTGRNLAKFIKASDDFALGKKSEGQDDAGVSDDGA